MAGERGSKDTARDVRGFAVKFYTDEGIWDLVGNNIPVFHIQDAIKFPDLTHRGRVARGMVCMGCRGARRTRCDPPRLPERVMAIKRGALSHHQSQLEPRAGGLDAVFVPSIVERVTRSKKYFFH